MAAWRREALKLLPELRRELSEKGYTLYGLFRDLLPLVREAHRAGEADLLRRAYRFAYWCFTQRDEALWNPAGVSFYEHLFDDWSLHERVVPWLAPQVVEGCWQLWEFRLSAAAMGELRDLVSRRGDGPWKATV